MNAIAQKAAVAKEQVKNTLGMNNVVHNTGPSTVDKAKAAVGMGPGTNPNTTSHV